MVQKLSFHCPRCWFLYYLQVMSAPERVLALAKLASAVTTDHIAQLFTEEMLADGYDPRPKQPTPSPGDEQPVPGGTVDTLPAIGMINPLLIDGSTKGDR